MDMQDKEFDEIFNQKFEGFEAEPSPIVWDNIAGTLNGKQSKRSIMPYLSIAAGVIVVLTAGILFLQKENKPQQHPTQTKLVASRVRSKAITPDNADTGQAAITKPINRVAVAAKHQHTIAAPIYKTIVPVNIKTDNSIKEITPAKTDNPQAIAAVNPQHIDATVPDNNIQLAPNVLDLNAQIPVERALAMASIGTQNTTPAKKHGIRSLGGLINVLIAQVDKREDKLIEFSDSDDDDTESNVTGVNLGIIKIKKQ